MRAEITGGEVSDYKGFDLLMDGELPPPKALIADKGYDSDHIRHCIEEGGGTTVIPDKLTRKETIPVDSFIYALRNQIERCFNKLKNARRLATRYDKPLKAILDLYISSPQGYESKRLSTRTRNDNTQLSLVLRKIV